MAEQIGKMPCDTLGCTSEMSVMQDKRKKYYTNCVCGTNKRNSNIGQKLFIEAWEKFQNNSENVEDDINGVLVGGVPEDEPETVQEIPEEKPNFVFPLFVVTVLGGAAVWLKKMKQ